MHLKVILVIFLTITWTVMSEFMMNIGFGKGEAVPNNTLIILKEGFNMKLWCDGVEKENQNTGRIQWDSCSWFRPNMGGSVLEESNFCKYDDRFGLGDCPALPPQFSSWRISKFGTRCVLDVTGVNEYDLGGWKCFLMPKNAISNSSSSSRETILRRRDQQDPTVNFNPGPEMNLTVGDSIQFWCNATVKAKNKPDIVWTIGSKDFPGNKHIDSSSTDIEEIALWVLDSALDYMADIQDDKEQVKCTVFVRDDFDNRIETFIPWTGLNISPMPLPPCFTIGSSWHSDYVTDVMTNVADVFDCQQSCATSNCSGFTHYSHHSQHFPLICFLFNSITTEEACEDCISGPASCTCSSSYSCDITSDNTIDAFSSIQSEEECQNICFNTLGCNLYTYFNEENIMEGVCYIFSSCPQIDETCTGCFTGPPICKPSCTAT